MKRWVGLVLILTLLMVFVPTVVAQGGDIEGDRTIFGRTFVLQAGQTMNGDLSVIGGTARIEEGARLNGDLSVVGGTVSVDGEVSGDVAIFGGSISLGETAVIRGDLASLGGSISRAAGARVEGKSVEGFEFRFRPSVSPPIIGGAAVAGAERGITGLILGLLGFLLRSLVTTAALAALAFIVTLFLPQHTRRVGHTASREPLLSVGLGCLSLPAAILLGILLTITIIGIPITILLSVAMIAAWIFGIIGLGFVLGDRMLRSADIRSPRPTASAVAGTLVLSLAWTLVSVIPCMDFVVGIIVSSLALGAVLLSRFGTARHPSPPGPDEPLLGPIDPFEPTEPPSPPPPSPAAESMEQMVKDIAATGATQTEKDAQKESESTEEGTSKDSATAG